MKIKQIISVLVLVLLCLGVASCKPRAKITIHVVSEDGKPVQHAPLNLGTFDYWQPGEGFGTDIYTNWTSTTDTNGIVSFNIPSARGDMGYGIHDFPGYYSGGGSYHFNTSSLIIWKPWNPTVEVIVKPIINPIPMYARSVRQDLGGPIIIPATNVPVGFDLEAGDWVAPYGKGSVPDFIFTMTEKIPEIDSNQPFDVIWTLSFANKGDGIQSILIPLNVGSALRFPRNAPVDGYQPTLVQEIFRSENQGNNGAVGEDQNYFFRVRTVLDEQGNIKSALYGKISGPIGCGGYGPVRFTYYLNPNPNDRNMEFDPSKNLFKNLPPYGPNLAP